MLTLLLVAMLTVVVVGFNATTRTEQMAARNYVYQVVADEMAKSATQDAISKLQAALQGAVATGFVTAPGQLTPFGGSAPIALFSSNATDIATPQATDKEFGTWIAGAPLVKPGFQDITNTTATSATNRIAGRYAFFIDDETTKVSLNSASSGRSPTSTNFFVRPFDIRAVPPLANASGALAGYVSGTGVMAPSFFFMPRQAISLNAGATQAEWDLWLPSLTTIQESRIDAPFVISNQPSVNRLWNRTPWGAEAVDINEVAFTDAGVNSIANAITNSRLNSIFTTTNGAARGFGSKYTNLVPQIAANILTLRSPWWTRSYLSNAANFAPPQNAPQPLGIPTSSYNVQTYPLPTGGKDMQTAGAEKKTNGIPNSYFGAVPFPMLTEISPSVVYGWVVPNRMTVRVVLELEFFNPYPTAYNKNQGTAVIVAQIDKARFMVNYNQNPNPGWRGPDGSATKVARHNDEPSWNPGFSGVWDPWGAGDPNGLDAGVARALDPINGIKIWPVPSVESRSYATEFVYFDVTFDEANPTAYLASPVYCIIDCIKILRSPADSSSVLDWCSGNDFFNALAAKEAGPAQFEIPIDPAPGVGSARGGSPSAGGANLDIHLQNIPATPGPSMAKRDPRMRSPLLATANWQPPAKREPGWAWAGNQQPSLLAANPGLLPGNFAGGPLPADQDYPSDAMQASFPTAGNLFPSLLANGRYEKAEDLGKVYTGVPWKTLSLQAQTVDELTPNSATVPNTPSIPDWVVLDLFRLAKPPIAPGIGAAAVNPNAQGRSAGGQFQAVERVATTMRSLAKPVLAIDTNQLSSMANNIARQTWSTNFNGGAAGQTWGNVRASFKLPADVIALPSEIAEILTVADHGTRLRSTNETRLSAFYPLISANSRFFGIYARGEAISGTNTMAVRQLKTTVEALIDPDSGGVKLETLFSEPVLD